MITSWNVYKRLEHLTDIDENKKDVALSICVANLDKVFSMVRDNCDNSDCRITEAAAAMSFYDLCIKNSSDGMDTVTSFKAGDVSISKSQQSLIEIASDYKREALNELIPLLKDESFFITLA